MPKSLGRRCSRLIATLGYLEDQTNDLKDLEEARMEESHEWLAERMNFQKRADSESGTSPKI
jgi:hypothetical protein